MVGQNIDEVICCDIFLRYCWDQYWCFLLNLEMPLKNSSTNLNEQSHDVMTYILIFLPSGISALCQFTAVTHEKSTSSRSGCVFMHFFCPMFHRIHQSLWISDKTIQWQNTSFLFSVRQRIFLPLQLHRMTVSQWATYYDSIIFWLTPSKCQTISLKTFFC